MRKKTILFVVNNFNIGGPQKSLLSLLYKLDYKMYDISIISLEDTGTLFQYLPTGVRRIRTKPIIKYSILSPKKIIRDTIVNIFSENYRHAISACRFIIEGILSKDMTKAKQRHWIKVKNTLPKLEREFDVAFGVSGGHSMMYIADCVDAKKKIGWIRSDYRVLNRDNELDRIYFKKMNEILSVSSVCKDIFLELFPEATSKTKVMYNILPFEMYGNIPADTSLMEIDNDTYKILTICRLDPNKGLDLAIEALETLIQKGIKVKWFILGDGVYRQQLEKEIISKGLEDSMILLGFQINTAEYIKKSDIIVHPSRFEGKSNVIDEAKYLLKPIVATRFNTVGEQLTHEKTGLIADMNADSIVKNIERFIELPELADELHANLKKVRENDRESLSIFEDIINN